MVSPPYQALLGVDKMWHQTKAVRIVFPLTTSHTVNVRGRCLASLGLSVLIGCSLAIGSLPAKAAQPDEAGTSRQSKAVLTSLQSAFSSIAEELEPTVVTISSTKAAARERDGEAGGPPRNGIPLPGSQRPRVLRGTESGVIIRKDGWTRRTITW